MKKKERFNFKLYTDSYHEVTKKIDPKKINYLVSRLKKIKNNKILIFGNGAGSAISSHFANDLSNTKKIKTFSFDNSAHLTCFSNDYGYDNWIVKTLEIFANKNDFIILLSASGNSLNMIKAAKFCIKKKINFFSITGFNKSNKLNKLSKHFVWIDSYSYNKVELAQLMILLFCVDKINE
tara:strand:- start:75 stop:614 length:540 start_codon:yes stop_codon:yes gene_type:complete